MIEKVWNKKLLIKPVEKIEVNYLAMARTNGGKAVFLGSTDGLSWRRVPRPSMTSLGVDGSMAYGAGVYVITDGDDILYSKDCYSWKRTPAPEAGQGYIYYANGKFFYIQYKSVYTSTDLKEWTKGSTLPFYTSYKNVVYHKAANKYLLASYYGLAYSSDGLSWTKATTASNASTGYGGVVYSYGKGVATLFSYSSDRVNLEYSANATSWTAISSISGSNYRFVEGSAAPQSKVLLAYNKTNVAHPLMAHNAGTTVVTDLTVPAFDNGEIYDLSWYNYRYYLAGYKKVNNVMKGKMYYSEDNGVNWTECTDFPEDIEVIFRIISNDRTGFESYDKELPPITFDQEDNGFQL